MTEQEYRSHPAVSRSELFKILDSPEKFKYFKENPEEPTPALKFGQLFHKLLLQPESFADEFAVAVECNRRTKSGQALWEKFSEESAGKTIITADEFALAVEMCTALKNNAWVSKMLKGEKEKEFFWTDEMTGEECKCRTDLLFEVLMDGEPVLLVIDFKTAAEADTESFIRAAINNGYDFQAAMYTEGVRANTHKKVLFVFVVIEKKPPYAINVLQADTLLLRRGGDLFREAIGIYHDCKETGNWYGYLGKFNQINNLSLPAWLAKEYE